MINFNLRVTRYDTKNKTGTGKLGNGLIFQFINADPDHDELDVNKWFRVTGILNKYGSNVLTISKTEESKHDSTNR